MAGTLYVFFGSSGIGKDYIQSEFINFSNGYTLPDGSKRIVSPIPRIYSRKKRETEDDTNKYEAHIEEVCSQDNYYSKINGHFVGIKKSGVKSALASGKNLVFVTGSIRMIEQLINDPDLAESICLIYLNGPGYNEGDYWLLEMRRNPNQSPQEIEQSAKERYRNSLLVQEYYQNNQGLFDYAYLNITKNANPEIAKKYSSIFFGSFFKAILELRRDSGPNWICNASPKPSEEMIKG